VWRLNSQGSTANVMASIRLGKTACNLFFYRCDHVHASSMLPSISRAFSIPWLESKSPLTRSFSDDNGGERRLEDILHELKGEKARNQYPVLDKRGSARKSSLGDLLRELKGEPLENPRKSSVSKVNVLRRKTVASPCFKRDAAEQVSALNKHFDAASLHQRKDSSSLDQQKVVHFVPDNTEVGELLKSLTSKGKFTESNVREIMSSIRPRPARNQSVTNEKLDKNQMKHVFISRERGKPFTRESKLFDGPQSDYFDLSADWDELESKSRFASIHEVKWKQIVESSVPKLGPTNAFEVLMLEADKLWKFPIDNEIGLDDEDKSTFEDHVFLGEYLEMFPAKGQVRRFMELVITGLQQNPYCSVKEKVDKIYWFKNYFDKFNDEDLEF